MRAILVFAAGCSVAVGPGPDTGPPDASVDASRPAFSPTWSYTSPELMVQTPTEDVAVTGTLRLGVRGFDQVATARVAPDSLRIVPRRGSLAPLSLLAEVTGNRSLVWLLHPLGDLWNNPIIWQDGTTDTDGRLLYHMLEGGVLDATWWHAPSGNTLTVECSAPPVALASGLYQLGALRVRVIGGAASVTGQSIVVTPQTGYAQLLVYTDTHYDAAAVDTVGALIAPAAGRVAERPGPVAGKHVRFSSTYFGVDQILALDGTPSDGPTPVVLADRAELYVGSPDSWRLAALAVKIIKTGPIAMRRMRYVRGPLGGQTFNFYVNSPRGTVTLWSVGRITSPYRLSGFGNVTLATFPTTDNDYSEGMANGNGVMHTRTAWAWDDTTLVEASTMTAVLPLSHTGQEGNSVDGGWRNTATGTLSRFTIATPQGFANETVPTGSYRFDPGDAAFAVYPTFSVYHQQRAWSGAWAERENRVAALRIDPTLFFGCIKALHNTDVMPAGSTLTVSNVIRAGTPTDDPAQLHARYMLGEPLRDGMLDLDRGAHMFAPWDLAMSGDEIGVVVE